MHRSIAFVVLNLVFACAHPAFTHNVEVDVAQKVTVGVHESAASSQGTPHGQLREKDQLLEQRSTLNHRLQPGYGALPALSMEHPADVIRAAPSVTVSRRGGTVVLGGLVVLGIVSVLFLSFRSRAHAQPLLSGADGGKAWVSGEAYVDLRESQVEKGCWKGRSQSSLDVPATPIVVRQDADRECEVHDDIWESGRASSDAESIVYPTPPSSDPGSPMTPEKRPYADGRGMADFLASSSSSSKVCGGRGSISPPRGAQVTEHGDLRDIDEEIAQLSRDLAPHPYIADEVRACHRIASGPAGSLTGELHNLEEDMAELARELSADLSSEKTGDAEP